MLVMSRIAGEAIVIGPITLVVHEVTDSDVHFVLFNESGTQNADLRLSKGETYAVPDSEVSLEIVDLRGFRVRFGIEAPKELPVHRKEIYEAIERRENLDLAREIEASDPAAQIAVTFGKAFTPEEIDICLQYVSEIYRSKGGIGLKVVKSQSLVFDCVEVHDGP